MIDISDLLNKRDNAEQQQYIEEQGIPAEETLPAEEFVNKIVKPIRELQDADAHNVKKIVRGAQEFVPVNGVVTFPSTEASVGVTVQEDQSSYVITSGPVVFHLRCVSVDGGSDTGNLLDVLIERRTPSGFDTVYTTQVLSVPAGSTAWTEVVLPDDHNLPDGESQVRITATDPETLAYGRANLQSVVNAKLTVEPTFQWQTPIDDLDGGIPVAYAITGTGVNKTMNLRIYDNEGSLYRELSYSIGTGTAPRSNPWHPDTNPKDAPTDTVKIMSHGVHTIEAWVSCTANGTLRESPHVRNQVMVIADEYDTSLHLMIQEVQMEVDNYVQVDPLFKFAVYKKDNTADGTKVAFAITDYENTENYMSTEVMAKNNIQYSEPGTVEIEGASVGVDTYAYFHATDGNGNNLLVGSSSIILTVHNQYNFSPVVGADLYINPSSRNNGEANPARILNAARGNAVIGSTFTGLSFDANDGWVQASDGRRVLRLLAGQHLSIQYDPFSEYASNYQSNVTIEFDVKISNITNEADPIVDISNALAGTVDKFTGLKLMPLEGIMMTSSQTVEGQQNFGIREGVRTHIAINICSAIYVDSSQLTIPLVRVFVNANPYREFMFALRQYEWGRNAYTIEIGQTGADIDIYGLRVYRRALSAQDVMQNYKSSLPTSAEKLAFASANDIIGGDGTISYELASQKYSCIVHYGTPPSKQNPDGGTSCWLHIDHRVNGVYDPLTSGDICKATKTLPVKGQGTTAKTYADWNQQYDCKKVTGTIVVDGQTVKDGWVDGKGNYKGQYYYLSTSDAKWQKLVGKINYASSMQSHKMGATNAYNDLYRAVMDASLDTIMANDSKTRCAVKEDMFFFFVQEEGETTPHFEGIMTFGAGKMDKKCWGYDSDTYPDFGMFEGSDNDQRVTNFERPWNDEVTYNAGEEYFEYNGAGNIDFDAGATDENEEPVGAAVTAIKAFFNFGFRHCTDILPWTANGGTATSLMAAADTIDTHKQYWVTSQDGLANIGDLYSWSPTDGTWVNARVNPTDPVRNILAENGNFTPTGDYAADNEVLRERIITRFKADGPNYYNVRSKLFHSCFVENLIAGSDNCAKNTYYVVDPVTHKICFHADDLDTIFKTDNVGWQTKPYYVDRVNHVDDNGLECYSGTHNFFFNTFDLAYDEEKQEMMKDIFTAMASISGSVDKFFDAYFFNIQRSIPCIAYLEQARIRYELRQVQVNQGIITAPIAPISQQLGSQLESELQYMDRRKAYFMSYAAYGEFGGVGGNPFIFRGIGKRDGSAARIAFTVKPHQYIFPTAGAGSTNKKYYRYSGTRYYNPRVRLAPGESYEMLVMAACNDDTQIMLNGIDYYSEIGNLGDISYNPAYGITLSGKRLTKVEAVPTSGLGEFRPSSVSIAANLVEEVVIKCGQVGSNLDLTGLTRLRKVDLRNSSITQCDLPETQTLTEVRFGANMTDVRISGMPNLATFSMQGYNSLQLIYVGAGNGNFDSLAFAQAVYQAQPSGLQSVSFLGVNWGAATHNVNPAMVVWLAMKSGQITGRIDSTSYNGPSYTYEDKGRLASKYGNIDDNTNSLYLIYSVIGGNQVDFAIGGEKYIHESICEAGSNNDWYYNGLSLTPVNPAANNIRIVGHSLDVEWSLSSGASRYAEFEDIHDSRLHIMQFDTQDNNYTLTARATLMSGTVRTTQRPIGFYRRIPQLGDFAYLDGSFDDVYDNSKDLAGIVYARLFYAQDPETVTSNNPILYYDEYGQIPSTAHYMKLCIVSKEYMRQGGDEGSTPINTTMAWGLYNKEANDSDGFPAATMASVITDILAHLPSSTHPAATSTSADFDVPNLTNKTGNNLPNSRAYADIIQTDDFSASTYKVYGGFRAAYVPGAPNMSNNAPSDWDGKANTKKIVDWAREIFEGYVRYYSGIDLGTGEKYQNAPSDFESLAHYMYSVLYKQLGANDANKDKYYQFAYPAAYACSLYEPAYVKRALNEQYQRGNWYLPACGELMRIYHHFNISRVSPMTTQNTDQNNKTPSASCADYGQDTHPGIDAWNPVFAKAFQRLNAVDAPSGVFANMSASYHWSSTEHNASNAWDVYFGTSFVGNNSKFGRYQVRPVVAFIFTL